MDYLNFELEIADTSGNEYPVTAISSTAGEVHQTMPFPFDEQTLKNQLTALQQALQNSGDTHSQTIQHFGQALFSALFTGGVRDLYVESRQEGIKQGMGLRVKLHIQPAELAALPWEFLYDSDQAQYLCLSDDTPVVRYEDIPVPPQPLIVTPPLCILGMTASPKNLDALDVAREKQRIETALAELQTQGLVKLTWLEGHTWQDLQQVMLRGPWHIFHFIGHGGFDSTINEGVIWLEDAVGQGHSLSATQVGLLLADHHPLRLTVLNSCDGARSSTLDIFSSTAATLLRRGIPAVLANQYAISDSAAIALSRTFYKALADEMPVDTAVAEARKAISLEVTSTMEWGTPVLYMHAPDGILFQSAPSSAPSLFSSPALEPKPSSSNMAASIAGAFIWLIFAGFGAIFINSGIIDPTIRFTGLILGFMMIAGGGLIYFFISKVWFKRT